MNTSPLDPPRRSAHSESLEALEKFLQQLPQTHDIGGQMRLTLGMVRSATRSDAVLLYTGSRREVSEAAGLPAGADHSPYASACRQLIRAADDSGQALLPDLPDATGLPPGSAALIRLSRSRAAWIIALRHEPSPPLNARDLRLMSLARKMLLQQQQQQDTNNQLKEVLFGLVRCLTATLDARDEYTRGHSERVARMAVLIGEQMRLGHGAVSELYLGGLLHDIGKVGVPDAVLRKPGPLDDAEFAQIKEHPGIGDAILSHVPQLRHLRPMVRSHHERHDGMGYPDGLAGDAVPLTARILAVADSCDAMLSSRPYRAGMPAARVEAILRSGAGTQWAPDVVRAWSECKEDILAVQGRGLGGSVLQAVQNAMGPEKELGPSLAFFCANSAG